MSVVHVKDHADIFKLETTLHMARRRVLESSTMNQNEEYTYATERLLRRSTEEILGILKLCVKASEDKSSTGLEERSAMEAAELEKEVATLDAEVETLQQKVVEAARRVAQLRGEVPEAISQHFRERLQACRPTLQTPELEMAAGHADTEIPPAALSPAPAELKGKLAGAAMQMPMLRAELEEKLDRLQRIVGAMDGEARAPAAPSAVERAARGLATPGAPAPADMPSPKLAQAVKGGKIAIRKKAMTNLGRPVPYPVPMKG